MAMDRNLGRLRRKARVRKKIRGTFEQPRLSVFRSCRHIYAQIIDDRGGKTLVSASTLEKDFTSSKTKSNREAAKELGKIVAKKALAKKIQKVVFDRGGYLYHGRLQALAEGAREAGLHF